MARVDGPAKRIFRKEYGKFLIGNLVNTKILFNILVTECRTCVPLPLRPKGEIFGVRIKREKETFLIEYNTKANLYFVLSMFEGLLFWPDKSLLHAGAVAVDNKAFVFTGKGNVGKTSLVLQGINRGYNYLSDDWLVVGNSLAYPLPKRIRIFDYNLVFDNRIAKKVVGNNYAKILLIKLWFHMRNKFTSLIPHPYIKRVLNVLRPIYKVDIAELNPNVRVALSTPIHNIFYLERKKRQEFRIDEMDPIVLANKMVSYNFFEKAYFWQLYFLNCFYNAFVCADMLCKEYEKQKEILRSVFEKANVYKVSIPENMSPETLWKKLEQEGLMS